MTTPGSRRPDAPINADEFEELLQQTYTGRRTGGGAQTPWTDPVIGEQQPQPPHSPRPSLHGIPRQDPSISPNTIAFRTVEDEKESS